MTAPNDRVRLVACDDEYTARTPGDCGTVTDVDTLPAVLTATNRPAAQVWVDWDDGGHFALLGDVDEWEVIE